MAEDRRAAGGVGRRCGEIARGLVIAKRIGHIQGKIERCLSTGVGSSVGGAEVFFTFAPAVFVTGVMIVGARPKQLDRVSAIWIRRQCSTRFRPQSILSCPSAPDAPESPPRPE